MNKMIFLWTWGVSLLAGFPLAQATSNKINEQKTNDVYSGTKPNEEYVHIYSDKKNTDNCFSILTLESWEACKQGKKQGKQPTHDNSRDDLNASNGCVHLIYPDTAVQNTPESFSSKLSQDVARSILLEPLKEKLSSIETSSLDSSRSRAASTKHTHPLWPLSINAEKEELALSIVTSQASSSLLGQLHPQGNQQKLTLTHSQTQTDEPSSAPKPTAQDSASQTREPLSQTHQSTQMTPPKKKDQTMQTTPTARLTHSQTQTDEPSSAPKPTAKDSASQTATTDTTTKNNDWPLTKWVRTANQSVQTWSATCKRYAKKYWRDMQNMGKNIHRKWKDLWWTKTGRKSKKALSALTPTIKRSKIAMQEWESLIRYTKPRQSRPDIMWG